MLVSTKTNVNILPVISSQMTIIADITHHCIGLNRHWAVSLWWYCLCSRITTVCEILLIRRTIDTRLKWQMTSYFSKLLVHFWDRTQKFYLSKEFYDFYCHQGNIFCRNFITMDSIHFMYHVLQKKTVPGYQGKGKQ